MLAFLQATKDVLAMASLEVDLSKIDPGNTITVKWRGKPVFIKRRTEEDIENANNVDLGSLRDPQSDSERVQNPEVPTFIIVHYKEIAVNLGIPNDTADCSGSSKLQPNAARTNGISPPLIYHALSPLSK